MWNFIGSCIMQETKPNEVSLFLDIVGVESKLLRQ